MSSFISEREGDNTTRVNSWRYAITHRMSLGTFLAVESNAKRESYFLKTILLELSWNPHVNEIDINESDLSL